ncbi:hypothetical protein Tco_0513869 [Tanacetum coccineum]
MSQLNRLAISVNSLLVKDMMVKLFKIDNEMDFRIVRETYAMCQKLNELQDYELEKCKELMKTISETQLKVLKKLSFIAKLLPLLSCAISNPLVMSGDKATFRSISKGFEIEDELT